MNARQIMSRDRCPATLALLGLMPSDFGMDGPSSFGNWDPNNVNFGMQEPGSFGGEYGGYAHGRFGADNSGAPQQREGYLFPNSAGKRIERYLFTMSQAISLGTAQASYTLEQTPSVFFRPQRMDINAPAPGFGYISRIDMANVRVSVGPGLTDMFCFSAEAQQTMLDFPTLSPSNAASLMANYTGFTPPGFEAYPDGQFFQSFAFIGPASMTP